MTAFMPLKITTASTWNLIETICVKKLKREVGAENANFNEFKSDKLLWSSS